MSSGTISNLKHMINWIGHEVCPTYKAFIIIEHNSLLFQSNELVII